MSRQQLFAAFTIAAVTLTAVTPALPQNIFLTASPDEVFAIQKLGETHSKAREWRRAFDDYTAVLALNPKFPEAFANRCEARYHLGDNAGAIDDCSEAIRLRITLKEAWFNRARAYEASNKYDKAERDMAEFLRLYPSDGEAVQVLEEFRKINTPQPPVISAQAAQPSRPITENRAPVANADATPAP